MSSIPPFDTLISALLSHFFQNGDILVHMLVHNLGFLFVFGGGYSWSRLGFQSSTLRDTPLSYEPRACMFQSLPMFTFGRRTMKEDATCPGLIIAGPISSCNSKHHIHLVPHHIHKTHFTRASQHYTYISTSQAHHKHITSASLHHKHILLTSHVHHYITSTSQVHHTYISNKSRTLQ